MPFWWSHLSHALCMEFSELGAHFGVVLFLHPESVTLNHRRTVIVKRSRSTPPFAADAVRLTSSPLLGRYEKCAPRVRLVPCSGATRARGTRPIAVDCLVGVVGSEPPSLCARSTVFATVAESYKFEPISQHERRGNWVCVFFCSSPLLFERQPKGSSSENGRHLSLLHCPGTTDFGSSKVRKG